jgi:hypothetical protein
VPGTLTVTAIQPDESDPDEINEYMRALDALYRWFGPYSLTRQQVNCKTGAKIGSPIVVQSRNAAGKLTTNFDFKDATVGSCWKLKLTLTKNNFTIESGVFVIKKHNAKANPKSSANRYSNMSVMSSL